MEIPQILANISIVDGDLVATTTVDPLVSEDDVTTAWNESAAKEVTEVPNVTPGEGDVEPETTESSRIQCVCDCNDPNQECLTLDECLSKSNEIEAGNNGAASDSDAEVADSTTETIVETTEASGAESDVTTEVPKEAEVPTTESSITEETTTTTTTTQPPPPPLCDIPGVQGDQADCHAYQECTSAGFSDGSNHLVTKFCASNEAFNVEFGRCSRDISSCPLVPVNCQIKGGVADPSSNTSYYLCEPRLLGGGFLIFHVQCSANQLFYPELGKCFIDVNNLPQAPYPAFPPYYWNQIEDIDIVKAEVKLIKEQDKVKLKAEKDRLKAEKKLQKEIQKQAEQRAKEEEKLKKELAKQESATFVCPHVGSFPSNVSDSIYYMCVTKKDKLKVAVMQCPVGSKFNADTGFCALDNSQATNRVGDDDDDDDDEDDD